MPVTRAMTRLTKDNSISSNTSTTGFTGKSVTSSVRSSPEPSSMTPKSNRKATKVTTAKAKAKTKKATPTSRSKAKPAQSSTTRRGGKSKSKQKLRVETDSEVSEAEEADVIDLTNTNEKPVNRGVRFAPIPENVIMEEMETEEDEANEEQEKKLKEDEDLRKELTKFGKKFTPDSKLFKKAKTLEESGISFIKNAGRDIENQFRLALKNQRIHLENPVSNVPNTPLMKKLAGSKRVKRPHSGTPTKLDHNDLEELGQKNEKSLVVPSKVTLPTTFDFQNAEFEEGSKQASKKIILDSVSASVQNDPSSNMLKECGVEKGAAVSFVLPTLNELPSTNSTFIMTTPTKLDHNGLEEFGQKNGKSSVAASTVTLPTTCDVQIVEFEEGRSKSKKIILDSVSASIQNDPSSNLILNQVDVEKEAAESFILPTTEEFHSTNSTFIMTTPTKLDRNGLEELGQKNEKSPVAASTVTRPKTFEFQNTEVEEGSKQASKNVILDSICKPIQDVPSSNLMLKECGVEKGAAVSFVLPTLEELPPTNSTFIMTTPTTNGKEVNEVHESEPAVMPTLVVAKEIVQLSDLSKSLNTTPDSKDSYNITLYEDFDEENKHRMNKKIPQWAENKDSLNHQLILMGPTLFPKFASQINCKRDPIFPAHRPNFKLFPDVVTKVRK